MTNTITKTSIQDQIRQEVTDTIIAQLEAGTVPWNNQWKTNTPVLTLPKNETTGNYYKGINILLLWCSALKNKYTTNEWGSFKQWSAKNEMIKKGEQGNTIIFYDTFDKEIDGEIQKIPVIKRYKVFNKCQLASYEYKPSPIPEYTESLIEKIDPVDEFIQNTAACIEHSGYEAYYEPSRDLINMPFPELFITNPTCTATEGYYSTLLHELAHWTGAKHRRDRFKDGSVDYAKEELVAELGAAFMCASFEIATLEKGSHATYIEKYLKMLKEDNQAIFKAASEASKAFDYLMSLQPE